MQCQEEEVLANRLRRSGQGGGSGRAGWTPGKKSHWGGKQGSAFEYAVEPSFQRVGAQWVGTATTESL